MGKSAGKHAHQRNPMAFEVISTMAYRDLTYPGRVFATPDSLTVTLDWAGMVELPASCKVTEIPGLIWARDRVFRLPLTSTAFISLACLAPERTMEEWAAALAVSVKELARLIGLRKKALQFHLASHVGFSFSCVTATLWGERPPSEKEPVLYDLTSVARYNHAMARAAAAESDEELA